MLNYGFGTDGHIVNGVLVSAAAPAATPGVATGIALLESSSLVGIQFIGSALAGAFTGTLKVEASCNFAPTSGGLYNGQTGNAGDWFDVTALMSPAVAAVNANGTQGFGFNGPGFNFRAIRVSLTRTGGTSIIADFWVVGKSQ